MFGKRWLARGGAALAALILVSAAGAHSEYNPVSTRPVSIGPEAGRLIVGFRATAGNTEVKKPAVEASTYLPDLTPPVTFVDRTVTSSSHVGGGVAPSTASC